MRLTYRSLCANLRFAAFFIIRSSVTARRAALRAARLSCYCAPGGVVDLPIAAIFYYTQLVTARRAALRAARLSCYCAPGGVVDLPFAAFFIIRSS